MTSRPRTVDFVHANASPLASLSSDAAWDDLQPLHDLIAGARVVALGEGAHFVAEFAQLRQRLIRFLAESCGFTVLAFEFGFAEAPAVDRWIRGEGGEHALAGLAGTPSAGLDGDMARWLRRRRDREAHPLRLVGLDTPEAGGDLRPALGPVLQYLGQVDPDLAPLVETALTVNDQVAGWSVAVAAPRWAQLPEKSRHVVTVLLSRLTQRFDALESLYVQRSTQDGYDVARHLLRAAVASTYMWGAMRDLFAGEALPGDTSIREQYMAETLLWHLERSPDERFVLCAHNNHIQKTPVSFDGTLVALPMGSYLHSRLGTAYRALALTHTADSVPDMHPDPDEPAGFSVSDTPMAAPHQGSVEAALLAAGLASVPTCTDLRQLVEPSTVDGASKPLYDRIRTQSAELETPVAEAFDAVLTVPSVTTKVTTRLR